jgi:PAS domain S-box-containing protein
MAKDPALAADNNTLGPVQGFRAIMRNTENGEHGASWAGEYSSLAAGIMCALSLWTWVAGVSDLLASPYRKVPMAPSTGLLLGSASVALWWLASRRRHPFTRPLTRGVAALLVAGGAFICLRHFFGWSSPVEAWLSTPAHGQEDLRVGEMSAATGAATMGVGICLGMLASPTRRALFSFIPLITATGLIFFETAVLAFYLAGGTWQYRGVLSPVALWSAVVLMLESGAILCICHTADGKRDEGEESSHTFRSRTSWLIASGVAFGMGVLGIIYLRHVQFNLRTEHSARLQALARSKSTQIANWRRERLTDADLLSRSSMLARGLERFLNHPIDPSAQADVVNHLGILRKAGRFASADFYDAHGHPVVVFSQEPIPAADGVLRESMRQSQTDEVPHMSEFYRCMDCGDIHQDIVVPLFRPAVGSGESLLLEGSDSNEDFLGWIILRLNPHDYLLPLLQPPAIVGNTCEILLLRRESRGATFLSTPREDKSLLFTQVDEAFCEAVQAHSIEELGRDYRGRTVLTGASAVQGTPWLVVAKVDWGEIHQAVHERAWLLIALSVIMAASAGLFTRLILARRERHYMESELVLERQRAALSERVETLMKMATDSILLADQQDRIVEVNDQVIKDYGYSWEELQNLSLSHLRAPDLRDEYHEQARQVVADGRLFFETLHQRKDGSVFPVEIHSREITLNGASYRLGIIRDVSERHKAEARMRASLHEKEVLLREVHHRVKNNLQLISSLLHLQASLPENACARPILQDTLARIRSMSLLHEALYRSDSFAQVDFGRYMQSLIISLRSTIPGADRVEFQLQFEGARLDLNLAVPCGLIVSELVTNSLKHAFEEGESGTIHVELAALGEEQFRLQVWDNGRGLPPGLQASAPQTLGLQLVNDLIRQIGGSLEMLPGPGTGFSILFSARKP